MREEENYVCIYIFLEKNSPAQALGNLKYFFQIFLIFIIAWVILKEIKPKAGVWRIDKFSKAVQLKKWIVLNLDPRTKLISVK